VYVVCVVSVAENLAAVVNGSASPGNDSSMYLSTSELKTSINFYYVLKKKETFSLYPSLS
jgi:hypothetical protein